MIKLWMNFLCFLVVKGFGGVVFILFNVLCFWMMYCNNLKNILIVVKENFKW